MNYRFLFIFLCWSFSSYAQFWFLGQDGKKPNPNLKYSPNSSVSLSLGPANAINDIAIYPQFSKFLVESMRWDIGLNYERHLKKNLTTRIGLHYLRTSGNDNQLNFDLANSPDLNQNTPYLSNYIRNLNYRTDIKELSLMGFWNIDFYHLEPDKRPIFYPYIGAGIALINFSPKGQDFFNLRDQGITGRVSPWQNLTTIPGFTNPFTDQKYQRISLAIPLAIGFNIQLKKNIYWGFELNLRRALTDFLEDVPDQKNLASNNNLFSNQNLISPVLANNLFVQKGNDWYFSGQFNLVYHFANKFGGTNCPTIIR